MKKKWAVAVLVFAIIAVNALAQEAGHPKVAPIIGVALDSSDGRIRNWSPGLLNEAAAVVEKSAANARVIILAGRGRDAADAAAKKGVDYLLTIELSPRPYASVSFGGPGTQDPEV